MNSIGRALIGVKAREACTARLQKKRLQTKRSPKKRLQEKQKQTRGKRAPALPQPPPGMPAAEHVIETTDFVSPQGAKYTILKTNETDAYDPPVPAAKRQRKGQ